MTELSIEAGEGFTEEELTAYTNNVEALLDVMRMIENASEIERERIRIRVADSMERPIAFATAIPQDVLLVGLRVMRSALVQRVKDGAK